MASKKTAAKPAKSSAPPIDLDVRAVFRDSHSHCCLRVSEADGKVQFIQLTEVDGGLSVDLHTWSSQDFYHTFSHELRDYPVWRAAAHFCNPLTPAIVVTDRAFAHLETILKENDMTATAAKKTVKKSTAQKNVDATAAAGIKTENKGEKVAPVTKDTSKVAGKSASKGKAADTKPGKKAGEGKGKKPSKTERDRQSYGDKKIKALVKDIEAAGVRAGTKRAKFLEAALKAKNTDEILGKEYTINGEKHALGGNNLAFMVEQGWISLS